MMGRDNRDKKIVAFRRHRRAVARQASAVGSAVSTLESQIDELYRVPLDAFVAGRRAIAQTLAGADRQRVAALPKPTVLAWLVNQTYWHARPVYERLLKAGARLRIAQVDALRGRSSDVPGATVRQREAVTEAMTAAARLGEAAGRRPSMDALRRMFETVSVSEPTQVPHGRFVRALQPAGFEALIGLPLATPARKPASPATAEEEPQRPHRSQSAAPTGRRASEIEQRRRERKHGQMERRLEVALKAAERQVTRASAAERRARTRWERAKNDLDEAQRSLAELQAGREDDD